MDDRAVVDGIEPEQFDQLIDLLASWTADGSVKIRVRPPARIALNFEEDDISRLLEQHSLPSDCIMQLHVDIPIILSGILSGNRNITTRFLVEHAEETQKDDVDGESIRREISHRIQQIEERFASAEVRRQYAIIREAKNATLVGTFWEINEKRSADGGTSLTNLVHATLRIEAKMPPTSLEREFEVPFGSNLLDSLSTTALTMTLTLEDLEDLSKSIDQLKNAMNQSSSRIVEE